MKIKIIYFGMLAETTEKDQEEVEFSGSDSSDLRNFLIDKYDKFKSLDFKIAVNQNIVDDNFKVKESDEVALLPPFAGG